MTVFFEELPIEARAVLISATESAYALLFSTISSVLYIAPSMRAPLSQSVPVTGTMTKETWSARPDCTASSQSAFWAGNMSSISLQRISVSTPELAMLSMVSEKSEPMLTQLLTPGKTFSSYIMESPVSDPYILS